MVPPTRSWRTWLIGRPLSTADAPHQAIGKAVGLAVFSSDALSSTAYATQEILIILAMAGTAALSLRLPDLDRDRRPAGDRHLLLRADDPRLPRRRRRLHRRARQPGRAAGADRGRGAADGLHPHRGRVGLVRRRAGHVGLPGAVRAPRGDRGRPRRRRDARQPARGEGVRGRLRGADLLLRRDDVPDGGRRPRAAALPGTLAAVADPPPLEIEATRALGALPAAARVLERHHGAHRRRGDLERHPRLQASRAAATPGSRCCGCRASWARCSSASASWPARSTPCRRSARR